MMGKTRWGNADNRKVAIAVTGLYHQAVKRRNIYTVIVPYYRLSQTIQRINKLGGQIVSVTVLSSALINEEIVPSAAPAVVAKSMKAESTLGESLDEDKTIESKSEETALSSSLPDSVPPLEIESASQSSEIDELEPEKLQLGKFSANLSLTQSTPASKRRKTTSQLLRTRRTIKPAQATRTHLKDQGRKSRRKFKTYLLG